jgi:hypothetical protein
MTVRFVCECGKRFAARNDMRGKQIQCPVCFSLVPVPSRRLFGLLGSAPEKPQAKQVVVEAARRQSQTFEVRPREAERSDRTFSRPQRDSGAAFSSGRRPAIRLRRPPRWTRLLTRREEPRWYHSITYPLVKVPVFLWLSVGLSILTAVALVAWVSIDRTLASNIGLYQVLAFSLLLLTYALGTTCTYFNSVLALAARGKSKLEPGIDASLLRAAQNCGVCLACLLAGPALLFGGAFVYWLNCGELMFVDWTILTELGFAGLGWWLFALLLSNAAESSFYVPFPGEVWRTALRLRGKALELVLLATAVFASHLLLAVFALSRLHTDPVIAFLLLCVFWASGLFCTAFTLRRLGLAYYRLSHERVVQ